MLSDDVEEESMGDYSRLVIGVTHSVLFDHDVIFHLQTLSNDPKEKQEPWGQNQPRSRAQSCLCPPSQW